MTFKQSVRNLHHPPEFTLWLADWLTDWLTDVNFRHLSQYCKVSKKLCTKNRNRKPLKNPDKTGFFGTLSHKRMTLKYKIKKRAFLYKITIYRKDKSLIFFIFIFTSFLLKTQACPPYLSQNWREICDFFPFPRFFSVF